MNILYLSAAALLLVSSLSALAQRQSTPQPAPAETQPATPIAAGPATPTIFPHSDTSRFLISGQANIIFQAHAPFHSPYQGPNSFVGRGEYKTSLLGTLFLGYQLRRSPRTSTDLILDVESSGGRGVSQALGLAGFTNLDVVRNPTLGPVPYLARVQIHQTIALGVPESNPLIDAPRTPFSLATRVPRRRLDLRVGKMSLPDVLDINSVGTDSHLQFLNWTVDNNGAWDYAADTRGYTYAAVAEYDDRAWSARYAYAVMPNVANGIDFDWDLSRAHGQNAELELRRSLLPNPERHGVLRLLAYGNRAHMGLYREANQAFLTHRDATPDITRHETFGALKYGFGINAEQELTPSLRAFLRLGWNEGQHESFAYTEVDQTLALGADYSLREGLPGLHSRRFVQPNDKLGLVFVSNAIKRDHQAYLALGGLGFLLGDGRLHYAREDILEAYYNVHTWRGLYYALDAQYITHPGYNADRGPALVTAVRMHVDF